MVELIFWIVIVAFAGIIVIGAVLFFVANFIGKAVKSIIESIKELKQISDE